MTNTLMRKLRNQTEQELLEQMEESPLKFVMLNIISRKWLGHWQKTTLQSHEDIYFVCIMNKLIQSQNVIHCYKPRMTTPL